MEKVKISAVSGNACYTKVEIVLNPTTKKYSLVPTIELEWWLKFFNKKYNKK